MSAACDAALAAVAADVPVLIWGPPGTGKTAWISAVARAAGAHAEILIGSTLDSADVAGITYPGAGGLVTHPPPWARRLREALEAGHPAWLVLDELSCAPPAAQAALLRVVQERRAGEVDLRGVRVVGAANPADSAADGGWLSAALAGRWAHVPWSVDADAWIAGELAGWGAPDPATAAARALVCDWIRRQPGALAPQPEPGSAQATDPRGWPSPRSWSALVRALAALGGDPRQAIASPAGAMLASAIVGEAAACEVRAWAAALDLPDPEEVLAGAAAVPARGDRTAATCLAVAAAAVQVRPDRDARVARAWEILAELRADATVLAARVLAECPSPIPASASALAARLRTARSQVSP